jgi:hypothetical protein
MQRAAMQQGSLAKERREPFWGNAIYVRPENMNMFDAEFISQFYKLLPLIFSLSGISLALVLYEFQSKLLFQIKTSFFFKKVYNFLSKKWFFDKVYNEWAGQFFFRFGYSVSYKIVDRGIFEMLGPSGMSMAISKTSSNLNKLETGYLYHYTFLILIGSTLLLGIRQFWLVFGSFVDYRAAIIFFIFSFIIININNNEATHFPRLELMPSRVLNFPDKSQNQTRVFDFVMLLLGAVFFFYQWYVLSIYALTAVVYMKYFSEIFPTTKTMLLAEYNQIDNTKYDGLLIDRYLVIFFVIVALIGFAFDIWIAKFYTILVIISVIARLFGFQLSVLFPSIIGFIKQVQKDRATLRYHWYTDFKICRNIIHISLISLVLSVIFALGASVFMNVPEDVQSLNTQLWLYMVLIHCFFGFSLDVYIILFK